MWRTHARLVVIIGNIEIPFFQTELAHPFAELLAFGYKDPVFRINLALGNVGELSFQQFLL